MLDDARSVRGLVMNDRCIDCGKAFRAGIMVSWRCAPCKLVNWRRGQGDWFARYSPYPRQREILESGERYRVITPREIPKPKLMVQWPSFMRMGKR